MIVGKGVICVKVSKKLVEAESRDLETLMNALKLPRGQPQVM